MAPGSSPENSPSSGRPAGPFNLPEFLDSLPHLVWTARPTGEVYYVGDHYLAYEGLRQREDQTWEWAPVLHPEDRRRTEEAWARALASGEPYEIEHRVRMRGGTYRWHLSRAVLVRDDEQGEAHWYGTATDIDQQKRAEESLAYTRWCSEHAQVSGGVGLWEWDLANHRIYLSDSMWKIFGLTPDGTLTPPELWARAVHPEDASPLQQHLTEVLASPDVSYHAEYRVIRPDGQVIWIESNAHIDRAPDGQPLCISGTHYDITRRKQLEQELLQSQHQFRTLLDAIPQLVWTATPDGLIDYCNDRMRAHLAPDAIGRTSWGALGLIHPDDRGRTSQAWRDALASGTAFEIEHRLALPPGVFSWHVSRAVPLKNPQGLLVRWYGTTTNIHTQKIAEAAHERAAAENRVQLQGANEQLEGLVYALAHDLRAPARAMQGMADILLSREGASLTEEGRGLLSRIRNSAAHLDQLTMDVVEYESLRSWRPKQQPVAVNAAWQSAVLQAGRRIAATGASLTGPSDAPRVLADPLGLTEVLHELLLDALKAEPEGTPRRVVLDVTESDGRCRITLVDNGAHPDETHAIFQPFHGPASVQTGRRAFGLAAVRRRIEMMKGSVHLEEAGPEGRRIVLEFPCADKEAGS